MQKTAIVTGGARGIGKSIALLLANEGYNITICARSANEVKQAEKEIGSISKCIGIVADVSKEKDAQKVIDQTKKTFGRIDVLVNNAGVAVYKHFKDTTPKDLENMFSVNVKGIFNFMKLALTEIEKNNGIIINISSGAGKNGIPGLSAYCASKFAVIGLTESVAEESKAKIVAVCPAGVDTQMYHDLFGEKPSLKAEHIAEKVVDICNNPDKYKSGDSIEIYHPYPLVNELAVRLMKNKGIVDLAKKNFKRKGNK